MFLCRVLFFPVGKIIRWLWAHPNSPCYVLPTTQKFVAPKYKNREKVFKLYKLDFENKNKEKLKGISKDYFFKIY